MSTYSFYEFSNYKKRSDVFAFLDSYSGTINESVLQEVYAKFGNDEIVNEAWGDWWNKAKGVAKGTADLAVQGAKKLGQGLSYAKEKGFFDPSKSELVAGAKKIGQGLSYAKEKGFFDPSKSPILQGAKEFGQEFSKSAVKSAKKGYKDTRTEKGVKQIEKIASTVGKLSKSFSQKFGIDPITASILISSAATGGLGAIPVTALAIGLRKGSAWLAGKGMDTAWEKITGKTPAELDQMWQSTIHRASTATESTKNSLSFAKFLENKDPSLYKNILEESMVGKLGSLAGTGVGAVAGRVAGTFVNLGIVLARALKNAAIYMANNPVKTGTMIAATAVGAMIGHYGTQAINNFIYEPEINQVKELAEAAKKVGVSNEELIKMYKDWGLSNDQINSIHSIDNTIKGVESQLKTASSIISKSMPK